MEKIWQVPGCITWLYIEILARHTEGDNVIEIAEYQCKEMLLHVISLENGMDTSLGKIVRALLKSKHHFKDDKRKSRAVQSILDEIGSNVDRHLEILDD